MKLVCEVLRKLLDAKFYTNLLKCDFHKTSLDYLGYQVSSEGVEMDPGKVKAILEWTPLEPEISWKVSWALPTSIDSLFQLSPKSLCQLPSY